ncbi:hypothetical protein NDU88_006418 [Pleurodeles waltl]|uniref:Uncharacterized protein n=1 Tax=Pleurodeles waltl TaxID=8319 RepID=A0AAV7UMX1_PLEWA|nr:hypothetical protein NDU88_006418 [Pleurodeles waltl]
MCQSPRSRKAHGTLSTSWVVQYTHNWGSDGPGANAHVTLLIATSMDKKEIAREIWYIKSDFHGNPRLYGAARDPTQNDAVFLDSGIMAVGGVRKPSGRNTSEVLLAHLERGLRCVQENPYSVNRHF